MRGAINSVSTNRMVARKTITPVINKKVRRRGQRFPRGSENMNGVSPGGTSSGIGLLICLDYEEVRTTKRTHTPEMKPDIPPDPIPGGHAGIDARLKLGPRIHPTAYVVPNATVVGDVTLMEESSVWYGAVIRGDINRIIIGPRSNVQDNAVVHIDTPNETRLGELVTVGHSAIVHACIIDDEVLIGMGAIILDGAEIGARSIIGANALVTLGTKIPPGSLVLGSPAKVKRALTLEEQKDIARWAWSYVETSKHFREFHSR